MLLSDFLQILENSELRALAIGNTEGSGIEQHQYRKLISNINKGVTALHTRFNLLNLEVRVSIDNDVPVYVLHSKYAQSNMESTEPVKYINDTVDFPFSEKQVIQLDCFYDEYGDLLPLNNPHSETKRVITTGHNKFKVAFPAGEEPMEEEFVSVIYKAKPVPLPDYIEQPELHEIDLPESYIQALTHYVVSRTFAGMPPAEGIHQATDSMNSYELACQQLTQFGIENTMSTEQGNIRDKGWV